jgi:SEC-C motif domain protein
MRRCPCLTGLAYSDCCEQFHLGTALAPTAERLMRSRYAAYALGMPDYLLATWHESTRPVELVLDTTLQWCGLDIINRTRGGIFDTVGTVEFRARYRREADTGNQHENSEFRRDSGAWMYVDAT